MDLCARTPPDEDKGAAMQIRPARFVNVQDGQDERTWTGGDLQVPIAFAIHQGRRNQIPGHIASP